ncbi:hypothetical protein [Prosthecomicrobium hirschii]|uniref:hypothetical protein n=1 Tax=Prosthecodimorpha hirschii TaxID=665126 RepID=UPI001364B488|nr:hypothetical protein [Prosthecomicrobium hirschii]MCW1838516.1 hypothetical protein [Prosthecomicrobium hirschii]
MQLNPRHVRKDEVEQVPLKEKPKMEDAKAREDKRLDEGVEESFPASDPVSVKITKI